MNVPLFSELPPGQMLAAVAASAFVASATSDDELCHVLPDLLCRFRTTLPMVAGPPPVFVTEMYPKTPMVFGLVAPSGQQA